MKTIKLFYRQFTNSSQFAFIEDLVTNPPMSPSQAFEVAVQALNQAFGGMDHGVKYKTEHFFLPTDWDRMSVGNTRKVGMCLSYLVATDLIPLLYANRPYSTNKLYMLKPDANPEGYSFLVR